MKTKLMTLVAMLFLLGIVAACTSDDMPTQQSEQQGADNLRDLTESVEFVNSLTTIKTPIK